MSEDQTDRRIAGLMAAFAFRQGSVGEFFAFSDLCVDWLRLEDDENLFEPDEALTKALNNPPHGPNG